MMKMIECLRTQVIKEDNECEDIIGGVSSRGNSKGNKKNKNIYTRGKKLK